MASRLNPAPPAPLLPMADVRALLDGLPVFDDQQAGLVCSHAACLVEESGERGIYEAVLPWLAGWQGHSPSLERMELCLFAGANSSAVTAKRALQTRMMLLASGGSPANIACGAAGAGLKLFDLASTQSIQLAGSDDAMTELDCVRTIGFGMEAISGAPDVLALAATGSASRDVAALFAAVLFDEPGADWVAGNSRLFAMPRAELLALIAQARQRSAGRTGLDLLCATGSREMAAVAGAIIAARTQRIPVLLSGFEACVAAALLASVEPGSIDHCLVAGRDGSTAHDRLLSRLGREPLLQSALCASDGLAAGLAFGMLRMALALYQGLPTRGQVEALLAPALGNG